MIFFACGFFHLAQCFQGSSMTELNSVQLLVSNNTPSYGYFRLDFSIHQLMNIRFVSIFGDYE